MEEEEDASGVYRPSMEVEQHYTEEKLEQVEEFPNTEQQWKGISPVVATVAAVVEEEGTPTAVLNMETEEAEATEASRSGGSRKRGRQSRVQTKGPSKRKEEEDVCFVCFDGGNLVLCDRRGCSKAYHPVCVNRDETFFFKGRWNCEWHICSICEKPARSMCYTCTYSLCKACITAADFVCVRENTGFCGTCLRMVMMFEKKEQRSNEKGQVDFDNKNSWEYLFKDYWVDLKGKLSLTLDEVTQAGNFWKVSDALGQKEESSEEVYDANDDKGFSSDSSAGNREIRSSKRRKAKKRLKSTKDVDSSSAAGDRVEGAYIIPDSTAWASKELLEFVAHVKKGDTSVLSQFDAQALLVEYIKKNNLRDPHQKSQIICDSRLENLFGKARVGHFEMLKLLELHFRMKEDSHTDDVKRGIVDTDGSHLEVDDYDDALMKAGKDKRRKIRKKGDEKEPQLNLNDYAAIDVHNISLIYLRHNLLEELLQETETFHDKVVGLFVKIKMSGCSQRQDKHRLVQVVGTSKADEPYKTGKRTTNIMLEILNLNKTEKIPIDTISNQEFSEDECKRLRQSIKCGFIKRMTVGEVQEKAMALQTLRVNDWLETEKLRLSNLRDRASEKGRRKELRECVAKLQLLNTPEERSRRVQEILEVHADPNMDPSHESDDNEGEPDDNRRDNYGRPRDAGFDRKGREPVSPGRGGSTFNDFSWSRARKNIGTSWEQSKTVSGKGSLERGDLHQPNTWEKSKIQVAITGSDTSQATLISGSSCGLATEDTPSPSVQSSNISDTEKMWLYQDPSGKIQGPFSMVQLRKWSTTGYFPANMRIWRTERPDDSILLIDALIGKFYDEPPGRDNGFSQAQKAIIASDNRENYQDSGWKGNKSSSWTEKTHSDESWNPSWKDSGSLVNSNGNAEYAKTDGVSRSTGGIAQAMDAFNPIEVHVGISSGGKDSSKANSAWSGQAQVRPHPSSRIPLQQGGDDQVGDGWGSGQNHGTWNANRSNGFQSISGYGHEKRSVNLGSSGQSSLESGKSEQENSKSWSTPSLVEALKYTREGWASDNGRRNDSSNFPTPTLKPNSSGRMEGQVSENKWSSAPLVPSHPANSAWGPTRCPGGNVARHSPTAVFEPPKSASDWGEQHYVFVKPSIGGSDAHSDSASLPKPSETPDQGSKIDFINTSTPIPKPSSGIWIGDQKTGNKWDPAPAVAADKTTTGFGSAPDQVGDGARESSSLVNEPSKVSVQWSGQSSMPTKSSDKATASPECSQVMHSSSSPLASVKPSEERDACYGSNSIETSISGYSESGSGLPTKYEIVSSPCGLVSISATGAKSLIQGPENDFPSSVHGSCSSLGLGKGSILSRVHDQQIPYQSTLADDSQKVAKADVLDANSLEGAEIDVGTVPSDFSARVGEGKGVISNSRPDPSAPFTVDRNTNTGADSVPHTHPTSKASELGNPNLASSVCGFKLPDETGPKQGSEIVDSSPVGFESHGWEAAPPLMRAAQKPKQPTYGQWVGGQFSGIIVATSRGTADQTGNCPDQTGNCPNPSLSVPESVLTSNRVQLTGTQGNDWYIPSAAAPRKPVGFDVASGALHGSFQNSSFAPVNTQPPISGNQCEWNSGVMTSFPTNNARSMGITENPVNGSRGQPQGNGNMGWGRSAQGSTNTVWGAGQGTTMEGSTNTVWGAGQGTTMEGNTNKGWGTADVPTGNSGMWASQQKHNGERFSNQGDRVFQGGDFGRGAGGGRSWNRQSLYGRGSSWPPKKIQILCKFHESGRCRKGAECNYLHT
ncbi:hypothetical protein NE237_024296 [Protea cynaroides]|uniref:Zinc finger CCCH domain-containing protein 44 n=1 Tax=Protea cynaroides TaxID=273540 RepID=A0A9Q0HDG5_9MAGN|nr:hypothetical protein NE237_024296 [Protea cynaroides]